MKKTALLSLAAACSLLCGCFSSSKGTVEVLPEKTFELGDQVILNPADYIESEDFDADKADVKGQWLEDPNYDFSRFNYAIKDAGKEYLETGTYQFTLVYDGKEYPVTIKVKDTVAPEFISSSPIVPVRVGDSTFDLSKRFTVKDKDEYEITSEGTWDINTPGEYPVTVIATDKSGNKSEIQVTIKVIGENQPVTETPDQVQTPEIPDQPEQNETPSEPETPSQPETPVQPETPEPEKPKEEPTACPVSKAPAGALIYSTFEACYQAGLEWNAKAPGNYFYYLQGKDDCGNDVFMLTVGSMEDSQKTENQ